MGVNGMLTKLAILYVARCFQMCKKILDYEKLCPAVGRHLSCASMFFSGERQKKNKGRIANLASDSRFDTLYVGVKLCSAED